VVVSIYATEDNIMRILIVVVSLFYNFLFFSNSATAAVVVPPILVQDWGSCPATHPGGCQLDGGLTVLDPIFSFSVTELEFDQTLDVTVVAPEFPLRARTGEGLDFTGFPIEDVLVLPGTSYTLVVPGGGPRAVSISMFAEDFPLLNANHNGFLPLGPVVSSVPIPAAAWLFGSAMLGLMGVARRKGAKANV
jgi:hypothetical protein